MLADLSSIPVHIQARGTFLLSIPVVTLLMSDRCSQLLESFHYNPQGLWHTSPSVIALHDDDVDGRLLREQL